MRLLLVIVLIIFANPQINAQGLSFSYLLPTKGYLSAPVSPFSIRGVGIGIGKTISLETGFSLYSMPGMAISDLPFTSEEPLRGFHFGLLIPLALSAKIDLKYFNLLLSAGGFSIFHTNSRINEGNWDRAIIKFEQWDVATSDLRMKNQLGYGWLIGMAVEVPVNRQMSISTGVNYISGYSPSPVSGVYSGGNLGGAITTKAVDYTKAQTQVQGFELMIGVSLSK